LHALPAAADNAAMEAEPPKAETPKQKRCWYQSSLRTTNDVANLFNC
jgi:hypothetical protein